MHEIKLQVETRADTSKREAVRLRRKGWVPGILYGRQSASIPLAVEIKELERVIVDAGKSALVQLELSDNGRSTKHTALVREVQRHHLLRKPTHVDFYQVSMERKLQLTIPVELTGEPIGCKDGGVLQHGVREIHVECLPANIPEVIRVDVSGLDTGDKLTVGDIMLPQDVRAVSDPDTLVAVVIQPELDVEPVPETEEPAEPVQNHQTNGKNGVKE